jgi:heme exporter protein B
MKPFRDLSALVKKDILDELKSGGAILSMFIFSLLIIVIFNLALGPNLTAQKEIGASVLWITIIFASTLGLNHSFVVEKENSSIKGLMVSPIDRGVLYLGKMVSNVIFLLVVEILAVPVFLLFFDFSISSVILPLMFILFLGTIGISAVGTVLSAISTSTKKRDILLPIILFPVIVPVLIGSVRCTSSILSGISIVKEAGNWISLLVIFDILFVIVSFLVFEFVLEEL